jgi:hypothetical protein
MASRPGAETRSVRAPKRRGSNDLLNASTQLREAPISLRDICENTGVTLCKKEQRKPGKTHEWVSKWISRILDEKYVYDRVQPKAQAVKAAIQVLIGLAAIALLIYQLSTHFHEKIDATADLTLKTIGVALAFSAAVELAYTFFTDGPDEALDPLILGISSFTLIMVSESRWIDDSNINLDVLAIPVLLLALSIFILFLTKKYLLEVRTAKSDDEKDKPPSETWLG